MNQQLIADIKASKAELERRGWTKSRLINQQGKVCALGAIGCALVEGFEDMTENKYGPFNDKGRVGAVVHALARQADTFGTFGADDVDRVFTKNDARDTTLEDVYNLFDKALAEEGGLA